MGDNLKTIAIAAGAAIIGFGVGTVANVDEPCPYNMTDKTQCDAQWDMGRTRYDWNGDGGTGLDDVSIAYDAWTRCEDPADTPGYNPPSGMQP